MHVCVCVRKRGTISIYLGRVSDGDFRAVVVFEVFKKCLLPGLGHPVVTVQDVVVDCEGDDEYRSTLVVWTATRLH